MEEMNKFSEKSAVSSEMKICPKCRSQCYKDSIICVNCGYSFQNAERQETQIKTFSDKSIVSAKLMSCFLMLKYLVDCIIIPVIEGHFSLNVVNSIFIIAVALGCFFVINKKNDKLLAFVLLGSGIYDVYLFVSMFLEFGQIHVELLLLLASVVIHLLCGVILLMKSKNSSVIGMIIILLAVFSSIAEIIYNGFIFDDYGYYGFNFENFIFSFISGVIFIIAVVMLSRYVKDRNALITEQSK